MKKDFITLREPILEKNGSKNKAKARIKIAKLHEKIANIRNDYLHKVSTRLIDENQVICLETLNVKEMLQGDYAKLISDVGMHKFSTYLEYKAKWYGRTFVKVDQYYPSSQLCSACGYQNPILKDLSIRKWTCPDCNSHHDRDVNAAKNILSEGKRLLSASIKRTVGDYGDSLFFSNKKNTGLYRCRENVSRFANIENAVFVEIGISLL